MSEASKCKHPACSCIAPAGKSYCSTNCEDAKNLTELACQCQHSDCVGEKLKEEVA